MTTLTLIRGVSGSGKSTLAVALLDMMENSQAFEADMYFYDEWGNYVFDQNKLHHAHEWCQRMTRKCLEDGIDAIVSNTFTRLSEMKPYFRMAKDLGVTFNVITCHGKFKNVHNVPEVTLDRQKERMFYGDVMKELELHYG